MPPCTMLTPPHRLWYTVPKIMFRRPLRRPGRYQEKDFADQDLKAFERRLTEVVSGLQPCTLRWRLLLVFISVCTAVGAYYWLTDPTTSAVSFTQSLWNHPFFTLSSIALMVLFILGIHKRVIAPSIITSRTRAVLGDYNMSCDDTGKLILKPRQTTN